MAKRHTLLRRVSSLIFVLALTPLVQNRANAQTDSEEASGLAALLRGAVQSLLQPSASDSAAQVPATSDDSFEGDPLSETVETEPVILQRTLWHKNGQKHLEGTLVDDQRDGMWTWWYDNGQEFAVMEYDMGTLIGVERHWSTDGELLTEGRYQDGAEWSGTFVDFDGDLNITALRSVQDGRPHGTYLWWFDNGNLNTQGTFVEGQRDGTWKWFYTDGQPFAEVTFASGRLSGTEHHWAPDGTLLTTGEYRDGEPWNGSFADFNGSDLIVTFQRSFKNGQPHGEWIWRFDDGTLNTQGAFVSGQKHGAWTWWHQNGQKFAEMEYDNGTSRGTMTHWSEDGELVTHGEYALDGREWNGTFVDFTSDLVVTARRTFADGQREGTWLEWHENGVKASEATYRSGRPLGTWTWWDDDGTKTSEERYVSAITSGSSQAAN